MGVSDPVILAALASTATPSPVAGPDPVFSWFSQVSADLVWLSPLFAILTLALPVISVIFFVFTAWFFFHGNARQITTVVLSPFVVVGALALTSLIQEILGFRAPCSEAALQELCLRPHLVYHAVPDLTALVVSLTVITAFIHRGFALVQLVFAVLLAFSRLWIGASYADLLGLTAIFSASFTSILLVVGLWNFTSTALRWHARWKLRRRRAANKGADAVEGQS